MNNFDFIEYRLNINHSINMPMTFCVEAYPVLHSDWLYRVFESAWARLLNEALPIDKLRISSGFPFSKEDSQVLNYVKSEEEFYPVSLQALQNDEIKQGVPCWRFQVRPRAAFSMKNQRREKRFNSSEIYFRENSGIWLGARFADIETRNNFEAVLRFLGDEGIGSARSSGYGGFTVAEINEIKFNQTSDCFALLCLSRFRPNKNQLPENLFRQVRPLKQAVLTEIGSKIQTREVLFFSEGTLLNKLEGFDYMNAGEILIEPGVEKQRKFVGFLFAIPVSNKIYE